MKTKLGLARAFAFFAALLALAAAQHATAEAYYWKGKGDNYGYATSDNFVDSKNNSAIPDQTASQTHNIWFREEDMERGEDKYNTTSSRRLVTFDNSGTSGDGKLFLSPWKTHVVGKSGVTPTREEPTIRFSSDNSPTTQGLKSGATTHSKYKTNQQQGWYIAHQNYDTNGDVWLRLENGKFNTGSYGLWVLGNYNAALDNGAGRFFAGNIDLQNAIMESGLDITNRHGTIIADNSTINVGRKFFIGSLKNSTGTLQLQGSSNLTAANEIFIAGGDGATGTVTIDGGTFKSTKGSVHLGGLGSGTNGRANTHAELNITGGATASSGTNTEIGNFYGSTTGGYALLSVSGGATYTCGSNLHMGAGSGCIDIDQSWLTVEGENSEVTVESAIYINGSKGGITIRNKGLLNVKGDPEHNADIALADGSRSTAGGDFAITLGDDGTLATPGFTFRDRTLSPQQVKLAFEGGTLKAKADNTAFIPKHDQLAVTVNEDGGIIDANGNDITIPASLTAAAGVATPDDITVKGGGSVEFTGDIGFGGNIKVVAGTILKLGDTAAESITANGALKIKAVIPKASARPVTGDALVEFTGENVTTTTLEDLAKSIAIVWDDGTDATEDFALKVSGKTIGWKDRTERTWIGAADGDFSDATNWEDGLKPSNGSTVYFAATAPVTANNDIEGLSVSQIVFAEGSAAATIAGNEIEVTGSVVNNSRAAQTISAPVVFTGDITTTMADAASTVTYSGGVTGAKIAASSAEERILRGHYTLTGEDVWPADGNGYSQQTTPANGEKWTLASGSTLRVKKANLKNFTIESGATAIAETACHRQQSYYERVDPKDNYKYYNILTEANHGTYKIGTLETLGNIEVYPAYSAENYSGGVTIVDKIEFGSAGQFGSMSTQAFYLSPGHRTASGWAGDGAGVWAVGAGGLVLKETTENSSGTIETPRAQYIWYRTRGDVTLKSIDDWTLYENPSNMPPYGATGVDTEKMNAVKTWAASSWVKNETVASLSIDNGATLTIDTSHFATNGETGVAGHTVTFEGQVQGDATAKVAATGDGTLFWKARGAKFTGTMAVGAGARLRLAGDGGGFQLAGLEIAAGGTLEIDPIVKPLKLAQTPQFAGGAKIALDPYYAATTLGKFTLLTWTGGEATIPEGLFDTSSVAQGAACALAVETAPDGSSKQLVLRVGDYEKDAKAIRIAPIGDSITQGVGGSGYATYRKSMAALLAARGYKPTLLGAWRFGVYDSAGVRQPEEWLWHTGFSGDSVLTTENPNNATNFKCGAFDNLHLYLDIVGVPDAIVLFIGTNDMSGGDKEGDVAYTAWTNLVWKIYEQRPQTKIVAGTALDRVLSTKVTGRQNVFNASIREAYKAGELPPTLSLVDLADYDNVPISIYTTIGNDGTHPNWNGHAYIARHFADGVAEALPLATFEPTTDSTVTDEPQTARGAANIPELAKWRRGFTCAYAIDIAPTNGIPTNGDAPYTWTNPDVKATASIAKVGYYVELVRKGTNRRRWVWVDMDATGKKLDDVDFPWNATAFRQEAVAKLHVKSNDFGIHEIAPTDDTVWGIVEATPYGYSTNRVEINAGGTVVKNLLPGHGWADTMFTDTTKAPYGCFQMHRVFSTEQKQSLVNNRLDAETLFAWNRWASTRGDQGDDLGIGPFFCSAAIDGGTQFTADYTHSANKQGNLYDTTGSIAYSVRRLEIWFATEENTRRGAVFMVK